MRHWLLLLCVLAAAPSHAAEPAAPRFPFTAAEARHYQVDYAAWAGLPVEFTNDLGMTFVLVPPGTFLMGSPDDEPGRNPGGYDEGPQHQVTLTRPFYLGKHEVTFGQFERFVTATKYVTDGEKNGGGNAHDEKAEWKHRPGTNWRKPGFAGPFQQRADHPVVHVSHTDALAFCKWLADQPRGPREPIGTPGLPTEAQWEWACRAGSGERYWWGGAEDASGKTANVGDRSLKRVHPDWPRIVMPMDDGHAFLAPVGSYRANGFGLHDMLGNAWEFCSTHYGPYPKGPVTDPEDGDPKRGFAVRGGGWSNSPRDVRSAVRNADPPHFCHSNLGFRVALALAEKQSPSADEILQGLKDFYRKTARPDGSFQPGVDPEYRGMSDSAYSDLAAPTYAVTIHKTFGWTLPHEDKTAEFLLSRQKPNGAFFNVAGTVAPESPEGRTYNTTQGLVALHALGRKPRHNPLPVFEAILKEDYKQLPAYSTSFFPLAYLCAGQPIPEKADRGIRALMVQDETGYMNDHVAATFHASHYYRLVGEETPRAKEMVARVLRDQKPDGSWLLNMPGRDRHATFDAVFILRHEGKDSPECRASIRRAASWALSCQNPDGGFGHFPGSPSDADAVYFQVGTLVMAGVLRPADPLPPDPHLLSWGHLMPVVNRREHAPQLSLALPGWVASVAFSPAGDRLAVASADAIARIFDPQTGRELAKCRGHDEAVASVHFHPTGKMLATGSYDHTAAIWDAATGKRLHRLVGHHGVVTSVAFSPDKTTLATASIDRTIKLWDISTGQLKKTLTGHKSWVNALAYRASGDWLVSGSSDGVIIVWSTETAAPLRTIDVTKAEIRSIALSADGSLLAAGLRYGTVKIWSTADWKEHPAIPGQGDMCAVAFSPSGKLLASTEGDWNRGGLVKIREAATGNLVASLQHTGEVVSVAFSSAGDVIAAGAADKTVRLWKIAPGSR
jgi:formylglycine-generating enzyme required for sulfatase activity/prenyltransferase beta subunit